MTRSCEAGICDPRLLAMEGMRNRFDGTPWRGVPGRASGLRLTVYNLLSLA
jgi:hypothetical protein